MERRRALLLGTAAVALFAGCDALAAGTGAAFLLKARAASNPANFLGNPRVTISAIDASGGIVASRSSGNTKAFVQVSAAAITATGTSRPYEDLQYQWDFGDPTGTETFVNPLGATKNANSDQISPEAVYCYVNPGIYTITLIVTGKGANGYITATTTMSFTANAFVPSAEYYFSQSGNDANPGTQAQPKQTIAALNALVASGRAFYLNSGDTWSGTTGIVMTAIINGLRLGTYGTGAAPIVENTSGRAFSIDNGTSGSGRSKNDIVVSGIDFRSSSDRAVSVSNTNNLTAELHDIYLYRISGYVGVASGVTVCVWQHQIDTGAPTSRFGSWGCSWSNQMTAGMGNRMRVFGGAEEWQFFVGDTMQGAGTSATLDHHMYIETERHCYYKWLNFLSAPSCNYCINMNIQGPFVSPPMYADYHCVSECSVLANNTLQHFHDASSTGNDPINQARFRNVVIERCRVNGLVGTFINVYYCAETITERGYQIWGCSGGGFLQLPVELQNIGHINAYENEMYIAAGVGTGRFLRDDAQSTTAALQITDNQVWDARASPRLISTNAANVIAAGGAINFNEYYYPAAPSGSPFTDNSVTKTFAQWQATGLDAASVIAQPNWPDPANGNFG